MASKRTVQKRADKIHDTLYELAQAQRSAIAKIKTLSEDLVKIGMRRGILEAELIALGVPPCGLVGCKETEEHHGHAPRGV